MGERGNIHLTNENIWFYTHWRGDQLGKIVRDALERGHSRWDDSPYLNRIIFCELITPRNLKETSGFGISNQIGDNGYPIVNIDNTEMSVYISNEDSVGVPLRRKTFSDLIKMSDEEVELWHLGERGPEVDER